MRRILAVARNTLSQGLRMKVPLILVIFLVVVVPTIPLLLKSDGTAKGQAHMILTYSLNVASFLICLLTVFLSVATLRDDMKNKHIFVMDITPLRRWELLAGKWLGIVALNCALVIVMGGTVYTLVKTVVKPSGEEEIKALSDEVYTARKRVKPEPPDTKTIAQQWYERFQSDGNLEKDHDPKIVLIQIEHFVKKHRNTVLPRMPRYWTFTNLPQPESPDDKLYVRYKVRPSQTPPGGMLRCLWYVGDRMKDGFEVPHKKKAGQLHELSVPASVVKPDGTLDIGFVCVDDTPVIFDEEKGLEVLYRSGSFELNFIKCIAFMVMKVGFLAAVGLAAATFLTFPVASLLVLFVFLVASVSGQAAVVMKESGWTQEEGLPARAFTAVVSSIWHALAFIFPGFSHYAGIDRVASGELITLWELFEAFGAFELFRGIVIIAIGAVILHRRELAGIEEQL